MMELIKCDHRDPVWRTSRRFKLKERVHIVDSNYFNTTPKLIAGTIKNRDAHFWYIKTDTELYQARESELQKI